MTINLFYSIINRQSTKQARNTSSINLNGVVACNALSRCRNRAIVRNMSPPCLAAPKRPAGPAPRPPRRQTQRPSMAPADSAQRLLTDSLRSSRRRRLADPIKTGHFYGSIHRTRLASPRLVWTGLAVPPNEGRRAAAGLPPNR